MKDSVKLVVDNAGKPVAAARKKSAKAGPESQAPYHAHEGRLCKLDGDCFKPLCNFEARIVEEVLHDDGEESETFFLIEGRLASGRALPQVEIPASSFAGLSWVASRWGAEAIVRAGSAVKDQLREAMQTLSTGIQRRRVYTHIGWRCLEGEWRYLHGAGAIGADGNREGVEVCPGQGNMGLYRLPAPPEEDALRAAVRASLELLELAPDRPELGAYLLAAIYRAPTAEAAPIDHSCWLLGTTGNFKSEAAALALAHFGEFDRQHLTANFTDSEGNIERKAYSAKDALFAVDDFKPVGGANEINKLHAKADRIFRGAGNQAGRGTLTVNRKERAAYYARGMMLATGEDLAKGESLRALLAVIELAKGDIDRERLGQAQRAARAGLFRQAMAGYLRWLAPQMSELKGRMPDLIGHFRDEALGSGFGAAHARTPSDYASLRAGLLLLIEFIVESGALSSEEARAFQERAETALRGLMEGQGDSQAEENEVRRFFALLHSALRAGRCHVSDRNDQGPPKNHPHHWGWRTVPGGLEEVLAAEALKPMGSRIGWTGGGLLWLDGDAAFAVAQTYARDQGGLFGISKNMLWKAVHEAGLLLNCTYEGKKLRKRTVKRRIDGQQVAVLELVTNVFETVED